VRWRMLYTCFPSGNHIHGRAARELTRVHLESFCIKESCGKTEVEL
jgi:hypothetical protein